MADKQIRCVITGLGVISAIGGNVEECWDSILASRSGIAHTNTLDTANCYADYAAEVKGLEENDPSLDRAAALCLRATGEALSDAGLSDFGNSERAGVIMGSCVGGGRSLERYYRGGKHREDILKLPISAIANQVAGVCHAGGVVTNVANACAAGTISIAYAADLIRADKADVVLAGGTDGFSSVPYAGFLSLHALDENSCSPLTTPTVLRWVRARAFWSWNPMSMPWRAAHTSIARFSAPASAATHIISRLPVRTARAR